MIWVLGWVIGGISFLPWVGDTMGVVKVKDVFFSLLFGPQGKEFRAFDGLELVYTLDKGVVCASCVTQQDTQDGR